MWSAQYTRKDPGSEVRKMPVMGSDKTASLILESSVSNTWFSLVKKCDHYCPFGRAAEGTEMVRAYIVIGRVGTVSMAALEALFQQCLEHLLKKGLCVPGSKHATDQVAIIKWSLFFYFCFIFEKV